MRVRTIITSLVTAIILSASAAIAKDEPATENAALTLAKEYLGAYSTFDVTKMEPFLSEEMVFFDPTSTTQNASGGAFIFEGKQAVITGLGDYSAQFKSFSLDYQIERQYESNGVAVFIAQLAYKGETKNGQKFEGSAPIVTTIATKDGKVTRHTDYYDYNGNAVNFSN